MNNEHISIRNGRIAIEVACPTLILVSIHLMKEILFATINLKQKSHSLFNKLNHFHKTN